MKTKITKRNILRKANRKRKPVTSIAQLAREFGVATDYWRWGGDAGTAAPASFREKVKTLVGEDVYNQIRDDKSVNISYR